MGVCVCVGRVGREWGESEERVKGERERGDERGERREERESKGRE